MIEAIKDLGEYVMDSEKISETDMFTINPMTKSGGGSIIYIKLTKDGDAFKFEKIDFKDYSDEDYKLTLYPSKVARGVSNSPTCKITGASKSFTNKIWKYFKKDFTFLGDEEKDRINQICACLEENKEQIINLIEEHVKLLPKKNFKILTLQIDDKDLIDDDLIKKIFITLSNNKMGGVKNNQCCACCSKVGQVYSDAFPPDLTFFTVDKPGFAYEFDKNNTYKMLPLCYQCAIHLRIGLKFIREQLNHQLYEENYFLIPHFLNKIDNRILKRIVEMRNFSTSNETKEQFKMDEAVILRKINQDIDNSVNFILLFYKKEKSALKILCSIEDIFPSRFNKVFEGIDSVNNYRLFENLFIKNPKLRFNFGVIRYFFPKSKNTKSDKDFFSVVSDIVNGVKIDYSFLLQAFMKKIEETFRQEKNHNVEEPTLKALLFLMFLEMMDLLKNMSEGSLMEEVYETKSEFIKSIRRFFEENNTCYNTNEKRAAFLVGCLVNNVLYAQGKSLSGSRPFSHRLKGLKLDLRSLKQLFNEAIAKLEQYKQKQVNEPLIMEISNYFSRTDCNNWKMSVVDINFFVAQGLSLAKQFIPTKQEDDKNE